MVTLVSLVPLLSTVMLCLACGFYVMKRKLLAQSLCVRQATLLQNGLKDPLRKLLRMNTHAGVLRKSRQKAETQLKSAGSTGYPPAIAAAEARLAAVILEQTEFHRQQLALLADAERLRMESPRELRRSIGSIGGSQFRSERYYPRGLAVAPHPPLDLSPNYEPVPGFIGFQQQRYGYQLDLLGNFPAHFGFKLESVQKINCSASLEERGQEWGLRILAAKAP